MRQALAGMADALDLDAAVLADMKMAVSEACTNVVVHAYEDIDGVLEVDMLADESGLTIRVRDHGTGIQPHPQRSRDVPALGLGLPLIAALSDAYELHGSTGQGTEVRMTFRYARDADPAEDNPVDRHGRRGRPLGLGRAARDAARADPLRSVAYWAYAALQLPHLLRRACGSPGRPPLSPPPAPEPVRARHCGALAHTPSLDGDLSCHRFVRAASPPSAGTRASTPRSRRWRALT